MTKQVTQEAFDYISKTLIPNLYERLTRAEMQVHLLENENKFRKDENTILNDRMLQLEYRIQQLEEKHND